MGRSPLGGDGDLALAPVPLFTREDFTLLQRARLVQKSITNSARPAIPDPQSNHFSLGKCALALCYEVPRELAIWNRSNESEAFKKFIKMVSALEKLRNWGDSLPEPREFPEQNDSGCPLIQLQ